MERRDFIKYSAVTSILLVEESSSLFAKDMKSEATFSENMYRSEFKYTHGIKEEHGYAYHCVNCQGNCSWEVWANDGIITRENQSAKYPPINDYTPDFNPRGCNKGGQHSQITYEPDRLVYPMKRVGKRGEGKWERVSWDSATTTIAEKIWDKMITKGPEKIHIQAGSGLLTLGRRGAVQRFSSLLGAVKIYPASYLGDFFSGSAVAYGEVNVGCTYDFMYGADTLVFWGANPSVSRIPDAHFVWEGQYNGAKVIVISPEFNASAKSADLWIPIKAGTDNFLAMSVIYLILHKKLYKSEFIKIYTDLPFLVRVDNKKMLREADIKEKGSDNSFYCFNAKTNTIALMPGTMGDKRNTLRLQDFGIDPILDGSWSVKLKDGKEIQVTTVFELLKKSVEKFSPQATQKITGIHPDIVKELTDSIAMPKVVSITTGFSLNKYYNGIQSVWNIASICGLTGRMGPYGGLNTENEFHLDGMGSIYSFDEYKARLGSGFVGEFIYDGMEVFDKYFGDIEIKQANNGMDKEEYKKRVTDMLKSKDKPFWKPDISFVVGDAKFRRNKGNLYRDAFLKETEFFTYIDYRMSETALYADILLPAKSHYEVWDIRAAPGYHRFGNLASPPKNLKVIGETKDEWEIFSLISKKLEEIANRPENISKAKVKDDKKYAKKGYRDLNNFYKYYTNTDEDSLGWKSELGTSKQAVEAILENVPQFKNWTIDKMYKQGGFLELNEQAGVSSPLYSDKPYNTMENTLFKFENLKTLTGRQTFYVDHDLWIRLGLNTNSAFETLLPKTKEYPYKFLIVHSRWAIHSTYRKSPILNRLQRGVPFVEINTQLAKEKGINDGDNIEVYNQLGKITVMAKVSNSIPKESIFMGHGFEANSFKNRTSPNEIIPTALNLLELSDGWGHLKFGGLWDGNQYAYDGAVNIRKV